MCIKYYKTCNTINDLCKDMFQTKHLNLSVSGMITEINESIT